MPDLGASTLARLKAIAISKNLQLQQLLNLFCQEEFLRRLSNSKYNENLILKGGFLLYSLSGFTTRPTMDADYLLKNYSNDIQSLEKLILDIISTPSENDFINFEIRNLETIAEQREYHGIRANLIGVINRTRTPFSIDFGVGDIIVPSAVTRLLPVILPSFDQPEVLTYSLESTVAEKFDAIISLMETTGRMKDFYDIYYLATTFNFEGRKIQEAIFETLTNRRTPYEKDSVEIISRLSNDRDLLARWNNFCKKVLQFDLSFECIIQVIISFLNPPFKAIVNEDECLDYWDSKEQCYK